MTTNENVQLNRNSTNVLDKLSQKFTAIKEDLRDAMKQRYRSISSDRESLSSSTSLINIISSSHDGNSFSTRLKGKSFWKISGNEKSSSTNSISTVLSSTKLTTSNDRISSSRFVIRDLLKNIDDRLIERFSSSNEINHRKKDFIRKSTNLLSGTKYRWNRKDHYVDQSHRNLFFLSISVGLLSLLITVWKPISSFISGLIVGLLFALACFYFFLEFLLYRQIKQRSIDQWIDFPALESMFSRVDQENKNTNIQVSGVLMTFQSYDADRDEEFIRYPCDIRLDGYRLIIQLAAKHWNEEKKSEKEMKFLGYREYLIKEARMILVPELTLTRAKYWMNDYPIVLQDLQILDKHRYHKQQIDKLKFDSANEFFTNNSTIVSIWFETCPQKEHWFHKLSLVLRKGKEEIERVNHLFRSQNHSSRTHFNGESKTENRSIVTEEISSKTFFTSDERRFDDILRSEQCLDEPAITINLLIRRLFADVFNKFDCQQFFQNKIDRKLKEIAISIFENLRVVSIDLSSNLPIILKIEPIQWNSKGIWFNLFLYYRGPLKLSVKTRVLLQKLINYDPNKNPPIFAQHHRSQIVHQDDEQIDFNDLISRHRLLAKEPEVPEMAAARRLGTKLTNLACNKYFQMFVQFPFISTLFEKFSEHELGLDFELKEFSGVFTLNIPPPPSDRLWVGLPEMPDFKLRVIPTYGAKKYFDTFLEDFLTAKFRTELKSLAVLPMMDDQLLPFFRDWAIDVIGDIVSRPPDPQVDNFTVRSNLYASIREGLQDYKNEK